MRPDVAPLGALISHRLAGPALRLDADSYPQYGFSRFPVSDVSAAFLPRSGVLSRHDTNVLVSPRD